MPSMLSCIRLTPVGDLVIYMQKRVSLKIPIMSITGPKLAMHQQVLNTVPFYNYMRSAQYNKSNEHIQNLH